MANIIVGMATTWGEACMERSANVKNALGKIVQATRRLRTKVENARRMFRQEAG